MPLPDFTPDINGQLKDAGLIAADAAWQVGGSNKILDLGAAVWTPFAVQVQVSAVEIASNDEVYRLLIQGSTSSTFASTIVNLAELTLGANEVLHGDVDSTTGTYVILGHNDVDGTIYRHIRGYTDFTGTIATGLKSSGMAFGHNHSVKQAKD